jgi:TolB protein
MNADGTGMTQLTTHADADSEPEWSPDGSKIVFERFNGGGDIYVIDVVSKVETPLAATGNDELNPEWSPDGRRIAYHRINGNADIWVMNADGTGQTQLTSHGDDDYDPAWSPDGSKIAFNRINGEGDIYVINVDGTGETRLTTSIEPVNEEPDWQPLPLAPIGGVTTPVNKLAILAPYIVLAGLIVAVSAVIIKKRK